MFLLISAPADTKRVSSVALASIRFRSTLDHDTPQLPRQQIDLPLAPHGSMSQSEIRSTLPETSCGFTSLACVPCLTVQNIKFSPSSVESECHDRTKRTTIPASNWK
jgi:hypothetical protein